MKMISCNMNLIFSTLLAIIITQFDMYDAGPNQSKCCTSTCCKDVITTIYGKGKSLYLTNTQKTEENNEYSISLIKAIFKDFVADCMKTLKQLCGEGNTEASACFEFILYNRSYHDEENNHMIKKNYMKMFCVIEIDESIFDSPDQFCSRYRRKMACIRQMINFFKYKDATTKHNNYGIFKYIFIHTKLENTTMSKDIPDTIPENNIPDILENVNVTNEELLDLKTTIDYVPYYIKSLFQKIKIDFSKLQNNKKFCEDQFKDLKPKAPSQT